MKEYLFTEKEEEKPFGLALIINKLLGNHKIEFSLIGGLQN